MKQQCRGSKNNTGHMGYLKSVHCLDHFCLYNHRTEIGGGGPEQLFKPDIRTVPGSAASITQAAACAFDSRWPLATARLFRGLIGTFETEQYFKGPSQSVKSGQRKYPERGPWSQPGKRKRRTVSVAPDWVRLLKSESLEEPPLSRSPIESWLLPLACCFPPYNDNHNNK